MYQSSYSSYLRTCHNGLNGSVRFESNQVVSLLSPATKICALALIHLKFSTTFRTKSLCCVRARVLMEESFQHINGAW